MRLGLAIVSLTHLSISLCRIEYKGTGETRLFFVFIPHKRDLYTRPMRVLSRHDGHQALAHGKSAEQEDVCWLGDWDGPETVWARLLCVAERRTTRPNGEWGYSTRRHMLGHGRPEAVSPARGVVLTDLQSSI